MSPEDLAEAFGKLGGRGKSEFCRRIYHAASKAGEHRTLSEIDRLEFAGSELPAWITDMILRAINLRRANENSPHRGPDVTLRFYDDREQGNYIAAIEFHFLEGETLVAELDAGGSFDVVQLAPGSVITDVPGESNRGSRGTA
jgi:hypothetical protein